MAPIRVLIADDHSLVRAGFCALLGSLDGIEVVAEASDGREALELIEKHKPDIAVLDITMANLNGLEAAARIKRDHPKVRVIMLSMHTDKEYVLQALKIGAVGYLVKDSGLSELERAVRTVASGTEYISPAVSPHLAEYVRRTNNGDSPMASPIDALTPRQREILQLIAESHSTQEIARKLVISVKTVETHRTQIMERLGVHDLAGLVRCALRFGLVSND